MLKFVIVDHRLRGQGIGGEMLRLAVRQIFDTTDAEAVHLNVFAENAAARRCYEKAGFRVVGEPISRKTPIGEGTFFHMAAD